MKLSRRLDPGLPQEAASFLSCLATVLELDPARLPALSPDADPAVDPLVIRWLGGLGMGLVRVADPSVFTWPGPWIARALPPDTQEPRFVVMYGVPSGVVWDPIGEAPVPNEWLRDGFVIAASDIALSPPPPPVAPDVTGTLERIWVSAAAGAPAASVQSVRALAGYGLEGDRHVTGDGTFPSGLPGSALTLIDVAVLESFSPPLGADEHRRNLVTRGLDLNQLVGHEFLVGSVRCRGARLCEPCTVVERYAGRPVLRELVHRGGLRADILEDGLIRVGDPVQAAVGAR